MAGSGGSDYTRSLDDAERLREEVRRELAQQERDTEINGALAELLAAINDRDVDAVRERLDQVAEALGETAIEVDRLLFGGSVAKHTYVDGLSDIDALVVVKDNNVSPADLLERFAGALRAKLPSSDVESVRVGKLAVTVTYRDKTEIQLLPAVERNERTSIASADGRGWNQIRPHKFAEKLTAANKANGNGVIPTIKLAKALIQQFPEGQKLSGYHIEAIAVDAFKDYSGRRDRVSMLGHLISHATDAVLKPSSDITGQSLHIDDSLGPANSRDRVRVSISLARLSGRLRNAKSGSDVKALFDA